MPPQESIRPPRPAWVEVDLDRLRRNFALLRQAQPKAVSFAAVVKDGAYGHGAVAVARVALEQGATFLAVSSLDEALELRNADIGARILLLGERPPAELPWCLAHDLTVCVNHAQTAEELARLATRAERPLRVHLKINTGMNRYGVRWTEAVELVELIQRQKSLVLEGIMSHFAQSDEADKTFARLQFERFREVLSQLDRAGITFRYRHICNSGGFLDLPEAHLDMVRVGILPLGVYPSSVCRRLPGLEPVMSVRARIATVRGLPQGESVGYGMRYTAATPRRLAVLPIGYADGFPRLRNQGAVLVHGQRAPIIGGIAMDATLIDVTDVAPAAPGDEVILMGRQGDEEISVHEVARWKNTVSYDILAGWHPKLPRVYREKARTPIT